MSRLLAAQRALTVPGWVKDELWRRARATPSLDLRFADSKSLVDATTGQNLVTFTRASEGTFVNSQGQIQTAAINAPRFDHNPTTGESLGLLVEEARTNSIRNNTMVGAVAGTPGTLPTNWVVVGAGLGTLTQQIVGTGTQNGINYIDIRISGTTSTANVAYSFDANTAIAALNGQSWTASSYLALVGGSISNHTVNLRINERTAAGAVIVNSGNEVQASLTSALTRYTHSRTLNQATTAFVSADIIFIFNSGVAIDITLRIGMPQLEQGAFATSVIPTTGTAATRSADVCSISGSNFSSWYRQDQGTVFIRAGGIRSGGRLFMLDDGTLDNRWENRIINNIPQLNSWTATAQDVSASSAVNLGDPSAAFRSAAAMAANNGGTSTNGAVAVIDSSCGMPTSQSRLWIGSFQGTGTYSNGPIARLAYFPQRLPNSTLQAITQ